MGIEDEQLSKKSDERMYTLVHSQVDKKAASFGTYACYRRKDRIVSL
jgi:hypothetical protein